MRENVTIKENIERILDMSKPVHLRRIQAVSDGDISIERELIETYLEACEEQVTEMEAALHDKNLEILKKRAHSIKGSSGTFGADGLRKIALKMEEELASEEFSHIAAALDQLKDEFLQVRAFLEEYLSKKASS